MESKTPKRFFRRRSSNESLKSIDSYTKPKVTTNASLTRKFTTGLFGKKAREGAADQLSRISSRAEAQPAAQRPVPSPPAPTAPTSPDDWHFLDAPSPLAATLPASKRESVSKKPEVATTSEAATSVQQAPQAPSSSASQTVPAASAADTASGPPSRQPTPPAAAKKFSLGAAATHQAGTTSSSNPSSRIPRSNLDRSSSPPPTSSSSRSRTLPSSPPTLLSPPRTAAPQSNTVSRLASKPTPALVQKVAKPTPKATLPPTGVFRQPSPPILEIPRPPKVDASRPPTQEAPRLPPTAEPQRSSSPPPTQTNATEVLPNVQVSQPLPGGALQLSFEAPDHLTTEPPSHSTAEAPEFAVRQQEPSKEDRPGFVATHPAVIQPTPPNVDAPVPAVEIPATVAATSTSAMRPPSIFAIPPPWTSEPLSVSESSSSNSTAPDAEASYTTLSNDFAHSEDAPPSSRTSASLFDQPHPSDKMIFSVTNDSFEILPSGGATSSNSPTKVSATTPNDDFKAPFPGALAPSPTTEAPAPRWPRLRVSEIAPFPGGLLPSPTSAYPRGNSLYGSINETSTTDVSGETLDEVMEEPTSDRHEDAPSSAPTPPSLSARLLPSPSQMPLSSDGSSKVTPEKEATSETSEPATLLLSSTPGSGQIVRDSVYRPREPMRTISHPDHSYWAVMANSPTTYWQMVMQITTWIPFALFKLCTIQQERK